MSALTLDLLRGRRGLLLSTIAVLLFVSIGYLSLYPSIQEQLETFAEDLPDAYRALLGDANIATASGYVRSQVYSLLAPLIIAGAAISAASGLARAEQDQTLAMFAVSPLSRRVLISSWWSLIVTVCCLAAAATTIGVMIGTPLAGADLTMTRIVLATLPLLLFSVLIGSIALLVATHTGVATASTGAGWATILVSFVLSSLAELVEELEWLSTISPWSSHGSGQALAGDIDLRSVGLLGAMVVLVSVAAVGRFERRNLHL